MQPPEYEFQWDADKAAANLKKHGVSFDEAETVFTDTFARIVDDPDHSLEEHRSIIMGYSTKNRLLVVCYSLREPMRFRVTPALLRIAVQVSQRERQIGRSVLFMKKKNHDDEMREHYDFSKSWRNPYAGHVKLSHGGARPGSGRKPLSRKMERHTVTLPKQHIRFLRSLDRNLSRAIRRLVQAASSVNSKQ